MAQERSISSVIDDENADRTIIERISPTIPTSRCWKIRNVIGSTSTAARASGDTDLFI
jgi:hypothetical protein